jgi:hypothetical protein
LAIDPHRRNDWTTLGSQTCERFCKPFSENDLTTEKAIDIGRRNIRGDAKLRRAMFPEINIQLDLGCGHGGDQFLKI